jgi:DNA-binding NarL/FixJ family response regulator
MSIRIVLVDDQELVRAGFRMVLDAQPDMEVVGEAGDGLAATQLLRTTPADVVVMDVRMPRLDGIEATRQICQAGVRHPGGALGRRGGRPVHHPPPHRPFRTAVPGR